jgi:regulator of sigma E protease
MDLFIYILIAILAFGVLIFTHELGHFIAAKSSGVRVLEFAMGMGPLLWKKQGKETVYSLRLFPIGGFCAMEGEDDSSEDPHAFTNVALPKRLLILVAGSFMNFLVGFLLILFVFSQALSFTAPIVTGFMEGCPYEGEQGLLPNDRIYEVNGERGYFKSNFSAYVPRSDDNNVDLVLIRNGEKVRLKDYHMVPAVPALDADGNPILDASGKPVLLYGLKFEATESGPLAKLKYSWYQALDFVRMVRIGLTDLLTGRASAKDLTGVVGIVGMISQTGQASADVHSAAENIAFLVAFIAVNLAVVNLLPLPALDGGRVVGLLLTWAIQKVTRRKLNPRIEGVVHFAGLMLLIVLMVYVTYNDIVRFIK